MNESPSFETPDHDPETERREEMERLGRELVESGEIFPFPGIKSEVYDRLKTEEKDAPGFITPTDTLIERFRTEGLKIRVGRSPENVFALPAESDDVVSDSLPINHLISNEVGDPRLRRLIELASRS
ncbi:MAG: hypothetical protein WDZ79_00940 [Candidatus Paceibacterota bacterium]